MATTLSSETNISDRVPEIRAAHAAIMMEEKHRDSAADSGTPGPAEKSWTALNTSLGSAALDAELASILTPPSGAAAAFTTSADTGVLPNNTVGADMAPSGDSVIMTHQRPTAEKGTSSTLPGASA